MRIDESTMSLDWKEVYSRSFAWWWQARDLFSVIRSDETLLRKNNNVMAWKMEWFKRWLVLEIFQKEACRRCVVGVWRAMKEKEKQTTFPRLFFFLIARIDDWNALKFGI